MLVSFLTALAVGLLVAQAATFATTVYLHRGLSHRSLTFAPPVAFGFRVMVWATTGIRPREWVAVHRKHHAHTDADGDPHSPKLLGWTAVQFGNVGLYRRVATDPAQVSARGSAPAVAAIHTVAYLQLNAAVNAIAHTFGRRPHDNGATNLQWLAWLTAGEGLHDNHHAAPTSAKLSLSRGEIDPAWPAIAGLRRLRLAKVRHVGLRPARPRVPVDTAA